VPPRGDRAKTKGNAASGDAAYNDAPFETGAELLARILTERRQNWEGRGQYKEPAAPDTSNLQPLPEGWTWASVEQIGRIETGNTPPKAEAANYGDEVPLVKPGELLNHPVAEAADNLTRQGAAVATTAPANSVLVSCIGNLGKTALTVREVAFNQQINAIIPTLAATARWIFYSVQQGAFRQQLESVASATTISIVNKSKFSALIVPLPPLAEQTRIVAEVERRLSVVEELESVVTANLQRATRLRQSILQKAFTGNL
jgi:type I restriction enzyme S subunit